MLRRRVGLAKLVRILTFHCFAMPSLFDPLQLGALTLSNRIVMAPLTRNRSRGLLPGPLAVDYYRQRASAGLIISEGAQINPEGQGYLDTPGIYSPEQVEAWKRVTDAVHEAGGKIAVQLWHVGRISHTELLPAGQAPVSSTARQAQSKTFTSAGFVDVSAPRALATDELPGLVQAYVHAARSAMAAGFDAVEVHGANGYLLDQFLRDSINDRHDAYGGAIENRARLLLEVMRAIAAAIGADRTGLRLSPVTPVNDAPVAVNDNVSTEEDKPIEVQVRNNDTDPDIATDGDVLTVISVTQGTNGTVAINAQTGNPVYTPKLDFVGTDTFTYTIKDPSGEIGRAHV